MVSAQGRERVADRNGTAGRPLGFRARSLSIDTSRFFETLPVPCEELKFFVLNGELMNALLGSRPVKSQGGFFHGRISIKFKASGQSQF